MCHEQWALTVIKLLRFFVLIFAVFYQILYFFCTTMTQSSKCYENCGCFLICTPHKTRTFTVRLAVTTKYGFAAEVLLGRDHTRVVPIGPIVRGVILFPILETWWLRPSRSICRRVMAFQILSNNDRPPFWILKILIFDLMTVNAVLTCRCIPNFIKIGSRLRPPDAHDCIMFNAPLLGNGRRHGNRIIAEMSGTWWDVSTQVASQSVHW